MKNYDMVKIAFVTDCVVSVVQMKITQAVKSVCDIGGVVFIRFIHTHDTERRR